MAEFTKGDRVSWQSHGGTAHGKVVRKITSDTSAGGRQVRASKDEPQYLVQSDNGGDAVHKPEALRREPGGGSRTRPSREPWLPARPG